MRSVCTFWRCVTVLGGLAALLLPLAGAAAALSRDDPAPRPFGADCDVVVEGSRATAYCHNSYLDTDRVQLHVECARWWDVDADSSPVDVAATAHATLTERCWKEIQAAWVSHVRVP
ncbi:hypothetical protein [Streptomyces formicae]|uniref:Secreted protein n=1 Tax=Streptomyces formicae TaxID=1616117 RepID=A0ABY3WSN8_9ACTN|nr:hypothetical protein [Streptomyces formicae]UNM14302.1 hypothetical protein J4032_25110 [Streptomyces formicae]